MNTTQLPAGRPSRNMSQTGIFPTPLYLGVAAMCSQLITHRERTHVESNSGDFGTWERESPHRGDDVPTTAGWRNQRR